VFTPYGEVIESLSSGKLEVDTIGMSGWTSGDLLGALDAERVTDVCFKKSVGLRTQLRRKQYQLVTLLIGTNDLGMSVSVETLIGNIRQLREVVLQHAPRIVLMTVPSAHNFPQTHELNQQIKEIVREHPANTLLFDCHALFDHAHRLVQEAEKADKLEESSGERKEKTKRVFDFDRLHFTVYGSELLGQKIYEQLVGEGVAP
jgi:lysophospholipase L1-like esterase